MFGSEDCPFCSRRGRSSEALVRVRDDHFQVSPGHRLVIPRRHVARLEDLSAGEWRAVFEVVQQLARRVAALDGVTGVNIGVNSGKSAGQTIDHAHVHVIPRRDGDVPDPRGGVRWVIPERADYWTQR